MKCWHCFNEVDDSLEYCPHCGRKLSVNQDSNTSDDTKTEDEETDSENTDRKKINIKKIDFRKIDFKKIDIKKITGKKIILIISILAASLLTVFFLFGDEIRQNDTLGLFHAHQWEEATCIKPKTCTVCSVTDGEALGHQWKMATCTEPQTCTRCKETSGKALGHTWVEATCTEPKTCSRCKETDGEALGHTWVEATCTEPKTCSRCKETDGEALGHKWLEATCTEPKTCSRCNKTEGKALGHDWREATYDDPKTCRRCGETVGTVKGFVTGDSLKGSFSEEKISLRDYDVSAFEFDNELYKCRKIKLGFNIHESTGNPFGRFVFWGRSDGDWVKIGSVYVEEADTEYSDTFNISPAIDIEAIAIIPDATFDHDVSWTYEFTLYNAQVE